MKLSFRNINKTSLFISLIVHLIAFKAHAIDTVAIVNEIKGTVFASVNGKTSQLKIGQEIILGSEVLTTSSGTVSLTDYYDHQFHLSHSSHIKMIGDTVQLRAGQVWMQSFRKGSSNSSFKLSSANGIAKYNYGEAIFSFDPTTAKSQLLVIQGRFKFSNINNEMDHTYVEDGLFSYIETEKNEGSPRTPTPVGFSSFKKITHLFNKVTPMASTDHIIKRTAKIPRTDAKVTPSWKNKKVSKRSIASVPRKSGNIIF